MNHEQSRRSFIRSAAAGAIGAGAAAHLVSATSWGASGRGTSARLKVGVIGCGGRGTGAVSDILSASPDVELWAMGDAFIDRVNSSRNNLAGLEESLASRCRVPDERCFAGFDAYQKVLASGVDIVILATNPHFRPMHFEAAVAAGKHVFMEKPVAVDPAGVRKVIAAGEEAARKRLTVVAGTQRRHETSYLAAMAKVREGAIGRIVSANCAWNQGGLWVVKKEPAWSDTEWHLRNWLYFAWTSGDHIVEQHVHNLDVCNWAIGATPLRCVASGGRQVRTAPEYGHIYDHFAVQYEYPGGVTVHSYCRQQPGCKDRVAEQFLGTDGVLDTSPGFASIAGANRWRFSERNNNPYVQEHRDLMSSVLGGQGLNEAKAVAEATLTAVMGRMAAYTGKEVTWEFALNESKLDLTPPAYAFGPLPTPEVAMPGRTPLI
ncbi:MAG: Gfo/Idh/MocA family oxidoreductase [Phycisphaeraceae bacterium]|nr:MAG: Gfo/Idh/MocA family oxidoreductase [Phycisphaeraceae bacterium]